MATSMQTTLRPYQQRMVDEIGSTNGIVVLPTGSGKTIISARIAQLALEQNPHQMVLMLVPTCLLVEQQAYTFRKELGIPVAECSGEKKTMGNTPFELIVSTPASFQQISLANPTAFGFHCFSLIIFDEVHHVVKKHPYRKIARVLALLPTAEKPQILGLTASLSYAIQSEKIMHSIQDLCAELSIQTVVTASYKELVAGGYNGNCHQPEAEHQAGEDIQVPAPISTVFPPNPNFKVHEMRQEFFDAIQKEIAHPICLRLMRVIDIFEKDVVLHIDPSFISPFYRKGKHGKVANWGPVAHAKQVQNLIPNHALACWTWLEHLYEATRLIVNSRQHDLELAFQLH